MVISLKAHRRLKFIDLQIINFRRRCAEREEYNYLFLINFDIGIKSTGFKATPFLLTSKCKWLPVEFPVLPILPIIVPCPTLAPALAVILFKCP